MEKIINKKIAVIGLGYVGLPLAVEFGKKRTVIGFDITGLGSNLAGSRGSPSGGDVN